MAYYLDHDVKYTGCLVFKDALTHDQRDLIRYCASGALYETDGFQALTLHESLGWLVPSGVKNISPRMLFNAIEYVTSMLKDRGNDFSPNRSHLISTSEYGIDHEALLFHYIQGVDGKNRFETVSVVDLIDTFRKSRKSLKSA